MDHRFSKHEYFISCTITLFYVGTLAASYFDIAVCPYSYNSNGSEQSRGRAGSASVAEDAGKAVCFGGAGGNYPCESNRSNDAMKSLLTAVTQTNGLSCHMVDIVVWTYVVGLVVFMGHKFLTYRMQGMHYFFLDYCYFHNAVLLVFLLWRLVDVRWSDEPLLSWGDYLPSFLRSAEDTSGAGSVAAGAFQHPLLTSGGGRSRSLASKAVVSAAKDKAARFPDGLYYPRSLDILTTSYVMSHLTASEVLSSFVVFFTLLAGSFGPILGAILLWKNALLFHSFDRMSSCYLHLMPATIQAMLLHQLFTSTRRELLSLSPTELFSEATKLAAHFHEPLEAFLPKAAAAALSLDNSPWAVDKRGRVLSKEERFARYAKQHPMEAFCGEGTMCYDLGHSVTFFSLLRLHFYMFLVWEIVYNVFSETRRRQREHKLRRKRLRELAEKQKEFMRLTGSTEEEAELLRPAVSLSDGVLGDPSKRVTAYTWMMDHPPGGKKGLPYRFVTCLGMGRLPTTALFQVTQWIIHVVFYSWCYPVLYLSFHCTFSAYPLLLYVVLFLLITVYNAACVNKKWIGKLQRMAAAGMEAERLRQRQDALPEPSPSPTAGAQARPEEKKEGASPQ